MLNNTLSLVCRGGIKIQKLVCKGRFGTSAYTHPSFVLSHYANHSLVSPASVPRGMHLGIAQFSWAHRANTRLSNHIMCFLSTVDRRTLCLSIRRDVQDLSLCKMSLAERAAHRYLTTPKFLPKRPWRGVSLGFDLVVDTLRPCDALESPVIQAGRSDLPDAR